MQSVYRRQGVEIDDKHIEVIVRQMLRKVKVTIANDTELLPGALVDIFKFEQENEPRSSRRAAPPPPSACAGHHKASLARIPSCPPRPSRKTTAC